MTIKFKEGVEALDALVSEGHYQRHFIRAEQPAEGFALSDDVTVAAFEIKKFAFHDILQIVESGGQPATMATFVAQAAAPAGTSAEAKLRTSLREAVGFAKKP